MRLMSSATSSRGACVDGNQLATATMSALEYGPLSTSNNASAPRRVHALSQAMSQMVSATARAAAKMGWVTQCEQASPVAVAIR